MSTALQSTSEEKPLSFVPYGQADAIKLSVKIIQNLIAVKTKTGQTCSTRDAMRFMMMCQAKRLNPFEGDAYLLGYDGKDGPQFSLITAHQAFLKRAETNKEFDGMESGVIVQAEDGGISELEGDFHLPDQKVIGGWARVHFKSRKIPTLRRLRLSRFQKSYGVWQDDPAGMIVKCAEADALRSSFPTLLGGLYMQGEVQLDVRPNSGGADMAEVSRLVEVRSTNGRGHEESEAADEAAEAEAGLAPSRQTAPVQAQKPTPQSDLEELIAAAGYDFATFVKVMSQTGTIKDADSLPDFASVPSGDAERVCRALRGAKSRPIMLEQFAKAKEQLV